MAIEQPEYRVLESDGAFELREYQPYMLAETAVDVSFLTAGNIAFGRLFRYISEKKIAMTAPVEQASSGGTYRVAFVVPRQFDRRSVPVPSDPRVTIREVPSRVVGAWRYSGRWTEENFRAAERSLREQLARRHLDRLQHARFTRWLESVSRLRLGGADAQSRAFGGGQSGQDRKLGHIAGSVDRQFIQGTRREFQ